MPVPKKAIIGMMAMIPMSPIYDSIDFSAHHNAIVNSVTKRT